MAGLVKRIIDILGSGVALLCCAPLLALTALAILLEDGRPVFFRQQRAGQRGVDFTVLKLRSMRTQPPSAPAAEITQTRADDPMVTHVGRVIRRLKIDELPQLVNVLTGDMSLVGPRPTIPEQVVAYSDFERRRLEMKPGLSGWAQVHGGIELSWPERILLDVWYIDHWSLALDISIVLKTVSVIVFGESRNDKVVAEAASHAERLGRTN